MSTRDAALRAKSGRRARIRRGRLVEAELLAELLLATFEAGRREGARAAAAAIRRSAKENRR